MIQCDGLSKHEYIVLHILATFHHLIDICDKMHFSSNLAIDALLVLVELNNQTNLDHTVTVFALVSVLCQMCLELLFSRVPRFIVASTLNQHKVVLLKAAAGPARHLEYAKV